MRLKWLFIILFLLTVAGRLVQAQEYTSNKVSPDEVKQSKIDYLTYLKQKKKLRIENEAAKGEFIQKRDAIEAEKERARVEFVASRDKRPSRAPASEEALMDYKYFREKKQQVRKDKEMARQKYINDRDRYMASVEKYERIRMNRKIRQLEKDLESE